METKTAINASKPFEAVCRDNAKISRHQQGGAPVTFAYGGEDLITWGNDRVSKLACDFVEKHHWKVADPEEASFLKQEDFHYSFAKNALELTLRARRNIDPEFLCVAVRAAKFMQAEMKNPAAQLEDVWEKSFRKAGASPERFQEIASLLKASWICGDELHDAVSNATTARPALPSSPNRQP